MDIQKAHEYSEIAEQQRGIAEKYAKQRKIASEAKAELDIFLTVSLPRIREKKSNVGIDMAYLMLMELKPDTKEVYKKWKEAEGLYKGYEKILEANSGALMFGMALMKYEKHGENFGN